MGRLYSSEELTQVDRATAIKRLREQSEKAAELARGVPNTSDRYTEYQNIQARSSATAKKLESGSGALTVEERRNAVKARFPGWKWSRVQRAAAIPGTPEKTRAVEAQREIAQAQAEPAPEQRASKFERGQINKAKAEQFGFVQRRRARERYEAIKPYFDSPGFRAARADIATYKARRELQQQTQEPTERPRPEKPRGEFRQQTFRERATVAVSKLPQTQVIRGALMRPDVVQRAQAGQATFFERTGVVAGTITAGAAAYTFAPTIAAVAKPIGRIVGTGEAVTFAFRALERGTRSGEVDTATVERAVSVGLQESRPRIPIFGYDAGPIISEVAGPLTTNRERFRTSVSEGLAAEGLTGPTYERTLREAERTRIIRGVEQPVNLLAISTMSEIQGQVLVNQFTGRGVTTATKGFRGFLTRASTIGAGTGIAGAGEGIASVRAVQSATGRQTRTSDLAIGAAAGFGSAAILGGIIGGTATSSPRVSQAVNLAAYTVDPFEKPGDVLAGAALKGVGRATRTAPRVPVFTVTPTTTTLTSGTAASSTGTTTTSQFSSRAAVPTFTFTPSETRTRTTTPTTTRTNIRTGVPSPTFTPSTTPTKSPTTTFTPVFTPTSTPASAFTPTTTTTTTPVPTTTPTTVPTATPLFRLPLGFLGPGGPKNQYRRQKGNPGTRKNFGYTASFAALELGITSSKAPRTPRGGFTGFEIRPLVVPNRKKRGKKRRKRR